MKGLLMVCLLAMQMSHSQLICRLESAPNPRTQNQASLSKAIKKTKSVGNADIKGTSWKIFLDCQNKLTMEHVKRRFECNAGETHLKLVFSQDSRQSSTLFELQPSLLSLNTFNGLNLKDLTIREVPSSCEVWLESGFILKGLVYMLGLLLYLK